MTARDASDDAAFRRDLVAIIPSLRAFARGLAGDRDVADDLAQEALAKAWAARASYTPGTNFRAWMFRILRNHFYSTASVAKRFVPYDPELPAHVQSTPPTQGGERLMADLARGLASLPAEQREAMLLVESGMQWDEAAAVVGCPLGTIKSRITRGRIALRRYIEGEADGTPRDSRRDGRGAPRRGAAIGPIGA